MTLHDVFTITPYPWLSGLIWFLILSGVFYLARFPAHEAIRNLSRTVRKLLRLAARAVAITGARLAERNRIILLAHGRELQERMIERELGRLQEGVERDLASFPALAHRLREEIATIDDDYKLSAEVPPTPPGWVGAVEAVAKVPDQGDQMVARVLEDIHGSIVSANLSATEEYRRASHKRHLSLHRMMPHWRNVLAVLTQVEKNVSRLLKRTRTVDRQVEEYQEVRAGSQAGEQMVSSSSLTRLLVSGALLVVLALLALFEFQFNRLSMQELVGTGSGAAGVSLADMAAAGLVFASVAVGWLLCETMQVTRMFPVLGAMDDRTRSRVVRWLLAGLAVLALVHGGLAYLREWMTQDQAAVAATLVGEGTGALGAGQYWVTVVAEIAIAMVLPLVVAFVAIALEGFVNSLGHVLGVLGVFVLRTLAVGLRFTASAVAYLGEFAVRVYDLAIFLPLWVERQVRLRLAARRVPAEAATAERPRRRANQKQEAGDTEADAVEGASR